MSADEQPRIARREMFLDRRPAAGQETSMEVTIRPCTPADRPAVLALIEPYIERRILLRRTFEELGELLPNSFLAEVDGRVVGFAALEVYSPKLAEIRSLVVDIGCQGRGIGRRLVAACVERARELHVFEVMAITSAEEFFHHCGFDFTLPGEKKAFFIQTRDQH